MKAMYYVIIYGNFIIPLADVDLYIVMQREKVPHNSLINMHASTMDPILILYTVMLHTLCILSSIYLLNETKRKLHLTNGPGAW